MVRRVTTHRWAWLVGWLALVAAVAGVLQNVRTRTIASLDRPEVRAQWQQWKEEAERQSRPDSGPVQRRPPRTNDPPALILMRDHFPAVLAMALVLATALYVFLAIAIRGAWRTHSGEAGLASRQPVSQRPTGQSTE